ncbi:MAG: signal peptidase II [Chlamydiales bacterium]|nr:signal peptidase II [Chlamydiales bacterium]
MINKTKKRSLFILFVCIILIDVITKFSAKEFLPAMDWLHPSYPYGGIGIFEDFFGINFSLNYVENRGTAWGLFSSYFDSLLIGRTVLILFLCIYLVFVNKDKSKQVPLVMIIAGAVGNIIDCFVYEYVVDMIHFNFWGYSYPVFNVADASICLGAFILMIQTLLANRKTPIKIMSQPIKFDLPNNPPKFFK